MKHLKTPLFGLLLLAVFSGCTDNQRVKSFGGTQRIQMKPNEQLMNVTWKNEDMWVLSEDTITHIKYFREYSSWGIVNGKVIITDHNISN